MREIDDDQASSRVRNLQQPTDQRQGGVTVEVEEGKALTQCCEFCGDQLQGVSVNWRYQLVPRGVPDAETLAVVGREPWIVSGPRYVIIAFPKCSGLAFALVRGMRNLFIAAGMVLVAVACNQETATNAKNDVKHAATKVAQFERDDHILRDQRRAKTRAQAEEEHAATFVAAERLHRRIVDQAHR